MKNALIISLAAALALGSLNAAYADDQAKIDATIARLGKVCKDKLMAKFPGVPMADLHVSVAATFQQDLDSGQTGLKELQKYGASYNWEVPPKKAAGSCEVSAKGKITQFIGK